MCIKRVLRAGSGGDARIVLELPRTRPQADKKRSKAGMMLVIVREHASRRGRGRRCRPPSSRSASKSTALRSPRYRLCGRPPVGP